MSIDRHVDGVGIFCSFTKVGTMRYVVMINWTAPFMVFSVIYYLKLRSALLAVFFIVCSFVPSLFVVEGTN